MSKRAASKEVGSQPRRSRADDMATLLTWIPGVGASHVARICERLAKKGGHGVTRWQIAGAKSRLLDGCCKTLRVKNTALDVIALDLQRAIPMWLEHSEDARRLWGRAVASAPAGEPWRLLLGYDEFDPGKALLGFHSRKVMLLDATFLEFGRKALCTDACWMTLACKPADVSHALCMASSQTENNAPRCPRLQEQGSGLCLSALMQPSRHARERAFFFDCCCLCQRGAAREGPTQTPRPAPKL